MTPSNCSICGAKGCAPGRDICPVCLGKVRVLKPASRSKVDKAAEQAEVLAEDADGKVGQALLDYIASGDSAGRKW